MYHLYILYSESFDKYYVGQTNNLERRILEHNEQEKTSFTAKYRPWRIASSFEVGASQGVARKIENHIKRQKSKDYIKELIERNSIEGLIARFGENA